MIESYNAFLERVDVFEKPELLINDQGLVPNKHLLDKVKEDNCFNIFFGDTVVFDLDSEVKEKVYDYIDILYKIIPECFCEKIKKETLHVTLHDLSNSTDFEEVYDKMKANELALRKLINGFLQKSIKMYTNYIINMTDTSLVLTLKPLKTEDYDNLMEYYELIDRIFKLDYKLTPHITLAYFNRYGFDKTAVEKLKSVVKSLNELRFEFSLNANKLIYQHFKTMNDYENVFYFVDEK